MWACLVAVLFVVCRAWGQEAPAVVDANVPPARECAYHLPFAELPHGVRSAAFAPDKASIYVHYPTPVFDTWRYAASRWPEVFGGVVGVATIVALILWRRAARRQRVAGAPHCRKCNYDLTAQVQKDEAGSFKEAVAEARCPECGVLLAKARPVRGRRLVVRVLPIAGAWAVCAGAYASMWIAGLPREGKASRWFDLSSTSLAEWATRNNIAALKQFIVEGDCIVEVDLRTGKVVRTAATRRSHTWSELAVTPDGAFFIIAGDRRGELQLISTRTGRRKAQVLLPENDRPMAGRSAPAAIGYSADGSTAFVQWAGRESEKSGVSAWNLTTGELSHVAQTASYVDPYPSARPFLLRSASPARVVSFPSFPEAYRTKSFVLRFHNADGTEEEDLPVVAMPDPSQSAPITSDGNGIYLVSHYGEGIVRVDLRERRVVGTLTAGVRRRFNDDMCLSRDDRYLAVGSFSDGVLVRDTVERKWAACLAIPTPLYGASPMISPDNRWVAATLQKGDGKTTGFRHELVIWNLAEILGTSDPTTPPLSVPSSASP